MKPLTQLGWGRLGGLGGGIKPQPKSALANAPAPAPFAELVHTINSDAVEADANTEGQKE